MKPKYYVGPNHCRCHPETCCCDDWAVYDSEDDQVFETFFRKEEAEGRLIELKSLDFLPKATEGLKLLKAKLDEEKRQKKLALDFVIRIKNQGDQESGCWCAEQARKVFAKITGDIK